MKRLGLVLSLLLLTSLGWAGDGFVYTSLAFQGETYAVPPCGGWAVGKGASTRLTPPLKVALEVRIPARDVARAVRKKTVTVLFPLNSARLTPSAREKLALIPSRARVRVVGYTCDLGTESYNLGLSVRRAVAVASYLERRGIKVLSITGKGECCPIRRRGKIDRPASRRVEIEED